MALNDAVEDFTAAQGAGEKLGAAAGNVANLGATVADAGSEAGGLPAKSSRPLSSSTSTESSASSRYALLHSTVRPWAISSLTIFHNSRREMGSTPTPGRRNARQ